MNLEDKKREAMRRFWSESEATLSDLFDAGVLAERDRVRELAKSFNLPGNFLRELFPEENKGGVV